MAVDVSLIAYGGARAVNVVGRLQYEKLLRFDQFNHLRTTFEWAEQ